MVKGILVLTFKPATFKLATRLFAGKMDAQNSIKDKT